MTDLNSQHSFQFRITGVTGGIFRSQTEQNVRKRIEKILYLETPPDDAVLLSYVGSKELSPANNLFIGDRSDSLYANSRAGKVSEYVGQGTTSAIYVRNTNFIVTQILNAVESGKIPLYYKHVLPLTIVAESVRIYDKNFEAVSTDKYRLDIQQEYDEASGTPALDDGGNPIYTEYHLYNNLESSYDKVTGEYEIYFVQYTDTSGTTDFTVTELLSNELAYKEASWDDIWSVTLDIKPWAKAYTWDPLAFSIGLPLGSDYGIKYQENKRISVKMPAANDDVHPWFPRIVNGSLSTSYGPDVIAYRIPEFENQAFNPMEPYKIAVRQTATKMDDYLVKLPHEDIQDGMMYSSFYMVFEKDGIAEYAITNDEFTAGTQYRDFDNNTVTNSNGDIVVWSSDLLLGLDRLSGIVHVSQHVDDSYEILTTYSYKESYYEVTSLNMNPVFDQDAHSEIRSLYIVPASAANGNNSTQTASVFWVKVSASGKIVATSQDGTGNNENLNLDVALEDASGYRLTGVVDMHYSWSATCQADGLQDILAGYPVFVNSTDGFPISGWIRFEDSTGVMRYAKFTARTDTSLTLSSTSAEVAYDDDGIFISSGATIELVNFIDERTTQSSRTYQNEIDHSPAVAGFYPPSLSRYFLLAEMAINLPHSHNDAVMIDVRENGGGVLPDKYEDAKKLNPQVQWLSDFGDYDGQIYPGNAVIVVKLPISLLERFSSAQIQKIVDENVPLGVKPIIRYYGYQPHVTYVGPTGEE
jgi:hypothetical protein